MARIAVLMLCHRIPYPADKGDKIRNLHLLRALQQVADVHLGCFIDSRFDLQYQHQLATEVSELFCLYRPPAAGLWQAAAGLLSGRAITSAWYADKQMQRWIDKTMSTTDCLLVSSAAMVQYCHNRPAAMPAVLDLVDVDSDKWRQYAEKTAWFWRWLYQREARLVGDIEAAAAHSFDYLTLVSDSEADCFRQLHPKAPPEKVRGLSNGVDSSYFAPTGATAVTGRIVFTGEMNYKPNVEAVLWFVSAVWPKILALQPEASFIIVGRNPVPAIRALHQQQNIQVTGRVDDVRPWLASAALVVAPMQLARGIKNKVLEAMAMAKPLVATPQAMYGLQQLPSSEALIIASDASDFAGACVRLLNLSSAQMPHHRTYVQEIFSWQQRLAPLFSMLNPDATGWHS